MKIQYVANNGKVFDDEFDCIEYEQRLESKKMSKILKGFDVTGKEVPFNNISQFCDDSYYIYVLDEKGIYEIEKTGYCFDSSFPGLYIWVDDRHAFCSYEEIIEEYEHMQKIKDLIMKKIDTVE